MLRNSIKGIHGKKMRRYEFWRDQNFHFWLKVLEKGLRPSASCQQVGVNEEAVKSVKQWSSQALVNRIRGSLIAINKWIQARTIHSMSAKGFSG